MASVGEVCQSVSVDLGIECDNIPQVHIAISLVEIQCAKHPTDHMHLIDRGEKLKINLINLNFFLLKTEEVKRCRKKIWHHFESEQE